MPSAPGKVTISVRVDKEVHAKFEAAAEADGRSIGNWLERAGLAALAAAAKAGDSAVAPQPPAAAPPRKRRARRS